MAMKRSTVGRGALWVLASTIGLFLASGAFAAGTAQWYATLTLGGTTAYATQYYPTKEQAIAAMRQLVPTNCIPAYPCTPSSLQAATALLSESGVSQMDAHSVTYSYNVPPIAPTVGTWSYEARFQSSPYYPTEAQVVATLLGGTCDTNIAGSVQAVSASPAGAWQPMVNPQSPPPPYEPWDTRAYTISTLQATSSNIPPYTVTCVPRQVATTIYRMRSVTCPPQYGFEGNVGPLCVISGLTGTVTDYSLLECPSNGSPSTTIGDPCDVSTGDFSQTETDFDTAGLVLRRYYHSAVLESHHALGVGWTNNYEGYLVLTNGIPTGLLRPNGHHDALVLSGTTGIYISLSGAAIHVQQSGTNWIATLKDGSSEVYNANGQLTQLIDPHGLTTTVSYNSNSQLSAVTGPFGHMLQFWYDTSNRISTVTEPDGVSVITYSYDSNNNLTLIAYPDTTTRQYLYEDTSLPNNLTGIIDEDNSRFMTAAYDDSTGAVASSQDGTGTGTNNPVSIVYSANGAVVTDGLGGTETYNFTNDPGFAPRATSFSHNNLTQTYTVPPGVADFQRRVTQKIDANGNVTNYSYDTDHLTSMTEAVGTPQSRTTAYQYLSPLSALPTLITEPLKQTAYVYYPGTNDVETKTVTDTTVTPNVSRTWTYHYYANGQLESVDGPRTDVSDVTTYAYYICTTGSQCGQIETITNALGQVTTFNTYNADGQPLTITDPNGVLITLSYDARQRVASRQVGTEKTSFSYYPSGLLQQVTMPDGSFVQYVYDSAHRLTDITDGLGNHIHYTLDKMGNHTAEQAYDPSGTLARTRSWVYNSLNELYQMIDAAGTAAVTTTYGDDANGNLNSVAAPLARNTTDQYDALNRLIQMTDPENGITHYGYDANDHLTSVTDPMGFQTSYTRDGFGDVVKQVSPDSGTTTFTYDSAGNVATKTDARGQTGTYSYDALNRVTQILYADQTQTFVYDNCTYGKGRLCQITDNSGSTSWTYTFDGRVAGKTQSGGGEAWTVQYGYNTAGQLTSETLPSGAVVNYTYGNNQVTGVSVTWNNNGTGSVTQPIVVNATYDPFGAVNGWTWGWGDATPMTIARDEDGRVSAITSSLVQLSYSYDAASRVTEIQDLIDDYDGTRSYQYDPMDRVSEQVTHYSPSTTTFHYDLDGNITSRSGATNAIFSYSAQGSQQTNNQLSQMTDAGQWFNRTYQYDPAGNETSDGVNGYTYNDAGRLATASIFGAPPDTIYYNALGQRVHAVSSGEFQDDEHYVYDEARHLIGQYQVSAGTILPEQETIWLGDIPVATLQGGPVYDVNGNYTGWQEQLLRVYTDAQHFPRRLSYAFNVSGVAPSQQYSWEWNVAGADVFGFGADFSLSDLSVPTYEQYMGYSVRFPGQFNPVIANDGGNTGLYSNGFRDYDPLTGRYVESDPIGLKGGSYSTYLYAAANPIQFIDPFGLDLTVTLYQGMADHIGIGVNSPTTYGYYPAANAALTPTGISVPGIEKPDAREIPIDTITIHTDPQQDAAVLQFIQDRIKNPGKYNLYTNNCAITVEGALSRAKLSAPNDILPKSLFDWLKQNYPPHAPR